jgi:hypothetical protein
MVGCCVLCPPQEDSCEESLARSLLQGVSRGVSREESLARSPRNLS